MLVCQEINFYVQSGANVRMFYMVYENFFFTIHSCELLCWFPWALTYILLPHPTSSFLGYDKMYILLLNLNQKFIIVNVVNTVAQKNLSKFPIKMMNRREVFKIINLYCKSRSVGFLNIMKKSPFFILQVCFLAATNTCLAIYERFTTPCMYLQIL